MIRLISVLNNGERANPMSKNVCPTLPYLKLSRKWGMDVEDMEFDDIDVLLQNRPSQLAYNSFRSVLHDRHSYLSLMWVALTDAWMTSVLEELNCLLKGFRRGFKEPYALKHRYHAILPTAITNLQVECLSAWLNSLMCH